MENDTLPCPEKDDYKSLTPGVLLSQEIQHYAERHQMITPFDASLLKPAGYKLRLGEDYSIGGKLQKLYDQPGNNELRIPPFEVAIISTLERINLPRFIIARWNLRVDLVYEGLLWTGALQVDPGWCGQLYCPIYNLSNEEVTLKLGDPIVLMDFVKTTPFEKGISKEYSRPPQRKSLRDYSYKLKSALLTEAGQKIKTVEDKVNRFEALIGLLFTSIAVLFTSLAILITSRNLPSQIFSPPTWFIFWIFLSMVISIIAISVSLKGSLNRWFCIGKGWFEKTIIVIIGLFLIGSIYIQLNDTATRKTQFDEIESMKQDLKIFLDNKKAFEEERKQQLYELNSMKQEFELYTKTYNESKIKHQGPMPKK